jgi:hypothetical protein
MAFALPSPDGGAHGPGNGRTMIFLKDRTEGPDDPDITVHGRRHAVSSRKRQSNKQKSIAEASEIPAVRRAAHVAVSA